MVKTETKSIATAFVEGDESWKWHLQIDPIGLYRWYFNGDAPTGLRGVTRQQADHALRQFVDHSIRGELTIVDWKDTLDPILSGRIA
jgi:hypothetical protein